MTHTVECNGLTLEISGMALTIRLDQTCIVEKAPLFMFACEDMGEIEADRWSMETEIQHRNLLTLAFTCGRNRFRVDVQRLASGIRISYTLSAQWEEVPLCTWMWLPWLQKMRLENAVMRYPANPAPRADGSGAVQTHPAFAMPFFLADDNGRGISVRFDEPAGRLSWDHLRNQDMNRIGSRRALEQNRMFLRLHETPTLVCEALIEPLTEGWCEAFERLRMNVRRLVDFTQYKREDLKWTDRAPLQHFAYAYGKEAFCYGENAEDGFVDIDSLLDAGEAFGGYDIVLLWHQYPRLGLDERSQWDFFDDFPGGLSALRELVKRAHVRGTKVILPFKPWDRSPAQSDRDTTDEICRIISETDADGIFFDTMNTVPGTFRDAIDAVKPGVVFISEGEPQDRCSIESITASWDQYSHSAVNLLRFLFPEHRRHAIARWHIGMYKDIAIERAVFQGIGMVIWQDIFGEWLPYSNAQKTKICCWKSLYMQYSEAFQSGRCVPLIPTLRDGLLANAFPGASGGGILTLFNDTGKTIEGPLVFLGQLPQSMQNCEASKDLWSMIPVRVEQGQLKGCIEAHSCCMIVFSENAGKTEL